MSNFEEQYTAWLDGTLDARQRAEFEASLPDRDAALRDAEGWKALRGLLREAARPQPMPHGEFISRQVMAEIRGGNRPSARKLFPVWRLAWAGATLFAVAALVSVFVLPGVRRGPTNEEFISQVVRARAGSQKLDASAFAAPDGKAQVLWVEDAGYIPADEKIR